MMSFVKFGYVCGCLSYRRRKRAVFVVLAVIGLFLLLHFEISLMQEKVVTSYVDEVVQHLGNEKHSSIGPTPDGHVHGNTNRITDSDRNLPLKVDDDFTPRQTFEKMNPTCSDIIEKPGFREIINGVVVYSVWFDDRKAQHFIRILMLTSKTSLPSITCLFQSASKQETFVSDASFYEHNENHVNRRFGGFVGSCVVPQNLDSEPCFVNISATIVTAESRAFNWKVFPVRSVKRQSGDVQIKYGICIPPVHGDVSVSKIIEFLELTQILGASHFTFYDFAMSKSVRNVLNYYQEMGLVSVFPWNLPSYTRDHVHYFGQPLAIWECLFRSMRNIDFVAFHDLDEFIVPLRHENISSLLEYIHKDYHCGHCFESVLFDPTTEQNGSHLLTQRVVHRTSQVTPYWTKCIVDPCRIFEQGIHHISKPNEEFYHADKVAWELARVFHYRKCKVPGALYQPSCQSSLIADKTMQKFGKKLLQNFELRMKAIRESKNMN